MDAMPELLAPAGGPDEFNAAIAAGADAIYCGFGRTFNARRGAQSFDSTTFGEACRRAHLAGVRVYVTTNVAIRTDELPSALALVRRAWLLGADAFIIQDWGLLAEVRRRWPSIECHVSTQANVHDARGVALCRELGAARVTLSRELSLPEISRIAQEGVDLECFCHGAICICYSGVCMMSSCAGARSANRGTCAQPCRLPYELVDSRGERLNAEGWGRPLCPKDFCAFDDLEALVAAGARSLKVEGRLKGPDYLASVIRAYRAQLDDLGAAGAAREGEARETTAKETEARKRLLKRVFNRDFTNAYLHGTSGNEMMSYERSNNRGELVGRVVDSRSFGSVKVRRGGSGGGRERLRTAHVAEVTIELDAPVGKGDLLEVRPTDDPSQFLTTHAPEDGSAGAAIVCRTVRAMGRGSEVRVIRSKAAMDAGERMAAAECPRRRAVEVRIRARIGEPFEVELATADGTARAAATGFVVEPARTRPVTEGDLVEHVGRMGDSGFEPVGFAVELDEGAGMGFSAVHAVRREACALLENEVLAAYAKRELAPAPSRSAIRRDLDLLRGHVRRGDARPGNEPRDHARPGDQRSSDARPGDAPLSCDTGCAQEEPQVCALVASPEAARAALAAGATRIYARTDDLARARGAWPADVVPLLDEVCREADHARLDPWVRPGRPVAVGNVSELALAAGVGAPAEVRGCIPVHNESCLAALESLGAAGVWLSPELSLDEVAGLAQAARVPVGLMVLGRVRAMTCEHCVLQVADRCVGACAACEIRRRHTYIKTESGALMPVRTDLQGRSRIYAAQVLDATPQVSALLDAGVRRLGVDATLLTPSEAADAVAHVVAAVDASRAGRAPLAAWHNSTTAHLLSPIQ